MSVGPLGLPPFVPNSSYFARSDCCSSPRRANDQPKLLCFRTVNSAIHFIRWIEVVECALQLLIVLLVYWLLFGSGGALTTNSYVLPALWMFYVVGGGMVAVTRLQQAAKHRDPNLFNVYIAYKRAGLLLYASLVVLSLSFVSRQRESIIFSTEEAVILSCSAIVIQLSVLTLIYVQRCKSYFRTTEQVYYQVIVAGSRSSQAMPPPYEEAQGQPPTYEQALQQSAHSV
uniref:Transmembrane protein n=1 Tax=Plectus sambesii TaxID=2011161 RepID=A0A914WL88_9BILA